LGTAFFIAKDNAEPHTTKEARPAIPKVRAVSIPPINSAVSTPQTVAVAKTTGRKLRLFIALDQIILASVSAPTTT